MITVDRLFGVVPSVEVLCDIQRDSKGRIAYSRSNARIDLEPSDELLGELSKLERGSRIALEPVSPEDRDKLEAIVIEGVNPFSRTFRDKQYWNTLASYCTSLGHEVHYLDHAAFWLESLRHDWSAQGLADGRDLAAAGTYAGHEADARQMSAEIKQHYLTSEVTMQWDRMQHLLQWMKTINPRAAVLEHDLAWRMWVTQNKPFYVHGIEFKDVDIEEYPRLQPEQIKDVWPVRKNTMRVGLHRNYRELEERRKKLLGS